MWGGLAIGLAIAWLGVACHRQPQVEYEYEPPVTNTWTGTDTSPPGDGAATTPPAKPVAPGAAPAAVPTRTPVSTPVTTTTRPSTWVRPDRRPR